MSYLFIQVDILSLSLKMRGSVGVSYLNIHVDMFS